MIAAAIPLELIAVWLVGAALALMVLALNIWQLIRYLEICRQSGPGTTLARVGWIVSVASWLTGPLALLGAFVGIGLGATGMRSGSRPADRVAGRMAMVNGVWILLMAAAFTVATLRFR